jgi:hypothetical protein
LRTGIRYTRILYVEYRPNQQFSGVHYLYAATGEKSLQFGSSEARKMPNTNICNVPRLNVKIPISFIEWTIVLQNILYIQARVLRFCYVVFNSHMFNATEVHLWKWCYHTKFLLQMRPIYVWRSQSRTPAGDRCVHFFSVITAIMDQKPQLLKPLNKR